MNQSRQLRCITALIALLSMLFMQLAVAAYACPKLQVNQDASLLAMADCTGMDMAQPSLCDAHRQVGDQSLDKPDLPQVQPFIAIALLAPLVLIDVAYRPLPIEPNASLMTRTTAPPLAIRHCCFQI